MRIDCTKDTQTANLSGFVRLWSPVRHPALYTATALALTALLLAQAFQSGVERLVFEWQRDALAQTDCVNRHIPAATLDCRAQCVWEATLAAQLTNEQFEGGATVPTEISAINLSLPYTVPGPVLAEAVATPTAYARAALNYAYTGRWAGGHTRHPWQPPRAA